MDCILVCVEYLNVLIIREYLFADQVRLHIERAMVLVL